MFDYSKVTLMTGVCECIFHSECIQTKARTGPDTEIYFCDYCHVTTPAVVLVTNRNCLKCSAYSCTVFCPPCSVTLQEFVMLKMEEQGRAILQTVLADFFQIHRLPVRYLRYYMSWLVYEWLQKKTLPFYIGIFHKTFCAYSFRKIILDLWKKQMLRPAGFHLESWMTKVHPNLQLLLNYSNDDLKSCYSALIENDGMIENADGTILPRAGHVIEHARKHTVSMLKGTDLIYRKEDQLDESLATRELFLEKENDFLYFSVPHGAVKNDNSDFYDTWVVALQASSAIYVNGLL